MRAPHLDYPERRLSYRIETKILIKAPARDVFDFVTTPTLWPMWYPATRAVQAKPDRSLLLGETVVEFIKAGPRSIVAEWTVVECEPGQLWTIDTVTGEGDARLTYTLAVHGRATEFRRVLQYRSRGLPWRWLDGNITRWMLRRQARAALRNLKRVLESGARAAAIGAGKRNRKKGGEL